jgi:hypothetical protein
MNEVLNRLADLFPPPDLPAYPVSPGDFTRIHLIHEPPQDLRDLFRGLRLPRFFPTRTEKSPRDADK